MSLYLDQILGSGFRVYMMQLEEGFAVRHCALSLVGGPIMYASFFMVTSYALYGLLCKLHMAYVYYFTCFVFLICSIWFLVAG